LGRNFFFVPTTFKSTPIPVNVDRKKLTTHLPTATCPMLKSNKNGIMVKKYFFEKVEHFKYLRINLANQKHLHEKSEPDGT